MSTTHLPTAQELAQTIRLAIETADLPRFGDRKVYLSGLHEYVAEAWGGLPRSEFNRLALEANRTGLFTLARADYVRAMDPALVAASEISDGISDFHFVLDESAR